MNFFKSFQEDVQAIFAERPALYRKASPEIITWMYFLCLSVFFQAFLDFLMEIFILLEWMPKMPFRIDFISLTVISTILGVQSLKGILHGKMDLTKNSILISMMVECALILGDLYLIFAHPAYLAGTYIFRLPFLFLTGLNLCLLLYVSWKMKIFLDAKGRIVIF